MSSIPKDRLQVALCTREYPPEVYGGAGVHIEHLARALTQQVDVSVHCFGKERDDSLVGGAYQPWEGLSGKGPHLAALQTFSVDLAMAAAVEGADVVHTHTWYSNLAGHLAKLMYDVPHVMTSHSLEPLRPWKKEQLGGGYQLSLWAERLGAENADALVAVSRGMREDILSCYPAVDPEKVHVIYNGIDTEAYRPVTERNVLERYGIDPDLPTVSFVGRITRQKGVSHLLDAAEHFMKGSQLVLCAGAPDTKEIGEEVASLVAALREKGEPRIIWIPEMLPRKDIVQILSHSTVFVCPSIYEPFGLVNVEAMACATPVVASAVGGIPEIVIEGETGHLVPFELGEDVFRSPASPPAFAGDMAERVNALLSDPAAAGRMGRASRARVEQEFSWPRIAARTAELYRSLI